MPRVWKTRKTQTEQFTKPKDKKIKTQNLHTQQHKIQDPYSSYRIMIGYCSSGIRRFHVGRPHSPISERENGGGLAATQVLGLKPVHRDEDLKGRVTRRYT